MQMTDFPFWLAGALPPVWTGPVRINEMPGRHEMSEEVRKAAGERMKKFAGSKWRELKAGAAA